MTSVGANRDLVVFLNQDLKGCEVIVLKRMMTVCDVVSFFFRVFRMIGFWFSRKLKLRQFGASSQFSAVSLKKKCSTKQCQL